MICTHTNTKIIATHPELSIKGAIRTRVRKCKQCGKKFDTIEITSTEYRAMRVINNDEKKQ